MLSQIIVEEQSIADLTFVEITDGPHDIGWTHPDEVNAALLDSSPGKEPR